MNSFTRMHNQYLDPDRHMPPEEPEWWHQCELNSRAIFNELARKGDTWWQIYRCVYKYTDCGPGLGILFDNEEDVVYCDGLRKFGADRIALEIHISSIVEGVEQTTDTHIVNLRKLKSSRAARKEFWNALEAVNAEAKQIWKATHGCEECAKLWGNCSPDGEEVEGCDGATPCHPDCKKCGGHGVVI